MRQLPALAVLLVAFRSSLPGQAIVQAPAGHLTGVVIDSITGSPVPFALVVVEGGSRSFASEGGRFALEGIPEGKVLLRIQQIGYRSVVLPLIVRRDPGAGAVLTVHLTRQPLVLPTLSVTAPDCRSAVPTGGGTLIEEVFRNAERLLVLQKDYPYESRMSEINSLLDEQGTVLSRRIDTTTFDSRDRSAYRRGRVLVYQRVIDREYATYFSPADLANPQFRTAHCFWFDGTDDQDGVPAYRIAFRPLLGVNSVDWAGSLVVDSATRHLLRSEAHLVNLPRQGTGFRAAGCVVLYMQVVPTLVQEFQAQCRTEENSAAAITRVQRWSLLEHRFLRRRPDGGNSGGGSGGA